MTFMEQWGPSIALMAVSIIIGAVWHKIILEPLSKLVEKTETLVDDYIISAISKPGKYCIWMYGLYKSLDLAGYNEKHNEANGENNRFPSTALYLGKLMKQSLCLPLL